MTTTVYFDLDGTLLEYTSPFSEILAQTLPVTATEAINETYTKRVLTALTKMEDEPYRRAFATVCEEYEIDAEPQLLARDHVRNEVMATRVAPSVLRLVEVIAADHQTGILTNGDEEMQRRKLDENGLDDLVDVILVSNEVGARKPAPEIFEEAKERLPAETHVYIGDTFEEDIAPAREQGFKAVYVGDEHRPDAPIASRGTQELAALLLPLFGQVDEE